MKSISCARWAATCRRSLFARRTTSEAVSEDIRRERARTQESFVSRSYRCCWQLVDCSPSSRAVSEDRMARLAGDSVREQLELLAIAYTIKERGWRGLRTVAYRPPAQPHRRVFSDGRHAGVEFSGIPYSLTIHGPNTSTRPPELGAGSEGRPLGLHGLHQSFGQESVHRLDANQRLGPDST